MSFLRLTCLCALTFLGTSSHAQNLPPLKPLDNAVVAAIHQPTADDFYSKLRETKRRNAPRVVFVPGILGSKIEECEADGSQCKPIWGTPGSVVDRSIDLSIRTGRSYRTDVVESLFFQEIYGGTLNHIRTKARLIGLDTLDDPLVTAFHYDWRVSNAKNAVLLAKRICDIRTRAPDSPIIIIAHSMGGLMTKVWAKRYAEAECGNGLKPEVRRIVFVATPHLGSPNSIKAFLQGYNILFDELRGIQRYIGFWESNYLLGAVNKAGMSFASLYELLPIRSSEYCRTVKPKLADSENAVVGEDGNPANLFDPETWERYDLLERIGEVVARRSFYKNELSSYLKQAEELLCDIVDFDPSKVVDEVIYLVGSHKGKKTYGWLHLKAGGDRIKNFTNVQGDGTVPVYSAQNLLLNPTTQTKNVIEADHTSIIGHAHLFDLINRWYASADADSKIEVTRANPQFGPLLRAETAASGNLLPVTLNASKWSDNDVKFAIEINSDALKLMGYSPSEVVRFASSVPDPLERANLYAIAASTVDSPQDKVQWAADVAQYAYMSSRFDEAIASSQVVVDTLKGADKRVDPNVATLEKRAKSVIGWSHLRIGDTETFKTMLSEYAKQYAVGESEFKEPIVPLTPQFVYSGDDKGQMVYSPQGENWGAWQKAWKDHYVVERPPTGRGLWGMQPN